MSYVHYATKYREDIICDIIKYKYSGLRRIYLSTYQENLVHVLN